MIILLKGNKATEVSEKKCPIFKVEGAEDRFRIYDAELYFKRTSNEDVDVYTLVNLSQTKGSVKKYYRVGLNGKVYRISDTAVKHAWIDFINSINDVKLIINGAEICTLSSYDIANKLGVTVEEAIDIIETSYPDALVVTR